MKLVTYSTTGGTLVARIVRRSDQQIYNPTSGLFAADTSFANSLVTLTEQTAIAKTMYASAALAMPAGKHLCDVLIYDNAGGGGEAGVAVIGDNPVKQETKTFVGGDTPAELIASQAGDEMDLVAAPNETAIDAIQDGLAVPGDEMVLSTAGIAAVKTGIVGAKMDLVDSPNAVAIAKFTAAENSGLPYHGSVTPGSPQA